MLDLLLLPFELAFGLLEGVFGLVGGIIGGIFGLLGGLIGLCIKLALAGAGIGAIVACIRRHRKSEDANDQEDFASYYDQHSSVQ